MIQNIIQNIETYSVNAVYCLVSNDLKKVYIAEGNVIKSLIRLLESFKQGSNHDIQKDMDSMELRLLDVSDDAEYRRLRVGYWMIQFEGYHQYRNRIPVSLSAKVSCRSLGDSYSFYVELQDKKYKKRVVGLFEKESEAMSFLESQYPSGQYIDRIIYADNEFTTKYRDQNKKVKVYGL